MTRSLPALPSLGPPRYRARDFYRVRSVQLAVVLALLNLEVAAILVASSSGPEVVLVLLFEAGSVWVGALLGERRAGRHWSAWASASAGDAYGKPPRRLWLAVGLWVVSAFFVLLVAKYWGTALCGFCLTGGGGEFRRSARPVAVCVSSGGGPGGGVAHGAPQSWISTRPVGFPVAAGPPLGGDAAKMWTDPRPERDVDHLPRQQRRCRARFVESNTGTGAPPRAASVLGVPAGVAETPPKPRVLGWLRRSGSAATAISGAVLAGIALAVSGCGATSASLPVSLRDGVLQVLATDGSAYRSYHVSWTVTTIGDLQAAAPMAGDDLLSGSSFFKSVYVALLSGSFQNPLCVPGHGSTCRGRYLLVALPITSRPGAYAEASQVSGAPASLEALGQVRHSTLEGLRIEKEGRVPDVVGLAVAQAEQILTRVGLQATVAIGGSSMIPTTVTRQVPSPGTIIRPGQTVELVMSPI